MKKGGQNLLKTWLWGGGGIRTHVVRKSAVTEKAKWDITQKPNTLPTRLCRRLGFSDVLVVCIRACWVIPKILLGLSLVLPQPLSVHYSIGPKYTVRGHGIPSPILPLSAKIAKIQCRFERKCWIRYNHTATECRAANWKSSISVAIVVIDNQGRTIPETLT